MQDSTFFEKTIVIKFYTSEQNPFKGFKPFERLLHNYFIF